MQDLINKVGTNMPVHLQEGYVNLTYDRYRGILRNNVPPTWAEDHFRSQYVFIGTSPRDAESHVMDRRDRMTIEGLTMDISRSPYVNTADPVAFTKARGVVNVSMTLQYQYQGNSLFGLYPTDYVRERTYTTQVYMRNWDINDNNSFRERYLSLNTPGQAG